MARLSVVTSITGCSAHSQGNHFQSSREVFTVELGSLGMQTEGWEGEEVGRERRGRRGRDGSGVGGEGEKERQGVGEVEDKGCIRMYE